MPEQKKILLVKYAAKPFSQLTDQEQQAHTLALIVKINIITGWPTPESEKEENILAEQLKLYLVENWALYNVDEIMYAMRSYATSINNWGKNMNLTLIGQALKEYENERHDVSQFEESKQPQTTNLLSMAADWRPLCEMYYQDYLNGKFHIHIMPVQLYDEFVRCNMMAEDVYEDYLSISKGMLIAKFKLEKSEATSKEAVELDKKIELLKTDKSEMIIDFAKKLSVEFLYKTASEKGFKNLFVKE